MQSDPNSPLASFFALREFVIAESRIARHLRETELSRPTQERVARGRCVVGLRLSADLGNRILRFTCKQNPSEFREGDAVLFHQGDPLEPIARGIWLRDGLRRDGTEFIDCVVEADTDREILRSSPAITVDPDFVDLSSILERAIEEAGATERGRSRILPLLRDSSDRGADAFDPEIYEPADRRAGETGFNPSQREAVAMGASADWCCRIAGPPGTGKTRVLAQIVAERIQVGQRILVTAGTHRAIHEALNRIAATLTGFDRIAKLGLPHTTAGLQVARYESFADTGFGRTDPPYVIGATPYAARSSRLTGAEFDCVIVDEAGQLPVTVGIAAMLQADRYVILGDPRQLPPVVVSQPSSTARHYSLYEQLSKTTPSLELDVTWRMNSVICSWISDTFYMGGLRPAESVAERSLQLSTRPTAPWLKTALAPETSLVWIACGERKTRKYSVEEADLAHQIASELCRRGVAARDIGILTPFRRQARLIRRRIQSDPDWDSVDLDAIVIDTVERMQGQEREVILISTAASDPGFIRAVEDFLYLPARLNVMVSRARTKVIVIASDAFLRPTPDSGSSSASTVEGLACWESLREAATVLEL